MAPVPVIFDTDLGEDIDDLYALYLALFHPGLRLLAVTTVHGDTQAKARLARKALRLAGRADIPVGAGIELSRARLERGDTLEKIARSQSYVDIVSEEDPEFEQNFPDAQTVIRAALQGSPEPVTLIGEGAYSNLAEIQKHPESRARIRGFALMGGEPARVVNEYNIVCDPEAADIVLNCGLPAFLGTLDLTATLVMTLDEVEKEFGASTNPVLRLITECTRLWEPYRGGKPGPVLYDLVPVFWAADPGCVETRPGTFRVELTGQYTRGQTVRISNATEPRVLESTRLNAADLLRRFISILQTATAVEKAR